MKANLKIDVTLSGIVIEVKDEQSSKAKLRIDVTLFPIVIEVKDEQLEKAYPGISPLLIVTFFNEEGTLLLK